MGIVRFALRWPYTFYVLALLILFLGVTAFRSMPADIFPEIDIPVVTVIWQYTGLSTPEMEQRVTTYSEYAMSTAVSGIKDIEAQTLDGISVQKIYFQPDVSIDLAIAQIINATNYIRLLMPPGIQSPLVFVPTAAERPSATQPFADFSAESTFSGTLGSAFALNQRETCVTAAGAAPPG